MGKGESMPSKRLRFPFSFFWLFTESWGNKQGLRQSPSNAARGRSMKVRPTQSRKGVKGQLPLAGSRDSVPCGVCGNAPTVSRALNSKGTVNKGAGSEASLPVTLRVRRRALKLLFPQDSVKNHFFAAIGKKVAASFVICTVGCSECSRMLHGKFVKRHSYSRQFVV